MKLASKSYISAQIRRIAVLLMCFCLYLAPTCCSNSLISSLNSEYIRILVIGDSIDRHMIQDWCTHFHSDLFTEISKYETNHSKPKTVHELFDPFRSRHRAWEIRICENSERKVYVGMIANKFGVKPHPPWHMPIRTMSGLEDKLLSNDYTIAQLFDLGLVPALKPLEIAMGGPPHGVLLNTVFWDLSHPDPLGSRSAIRKHAWLEEWSNNATIFIEVVKNHFPQTKWFGWHTANQFYVGASHWCTDLTLSLLHSMNSASQYIASNTSIDWINFTKFPIKLRDGLHPTPPPLIKLCEETIKRVNASRL